MEISEIDSIEVARSKASATTHTILRVDRHFARCFIEDKAIVGTLCKALFTTSALVGLDDWLTADMLLGLARTRATTHTDVLYRTAEACHLVALEVIEADEYVGIHHCTANLGTLDILSTLDLNVYIISSLQSITNDDWATNREGREAILPGAVEVLDSILA